MHTDAPPPAPAVQMDIMMQAIEIFKQIDVNGSNSVEWDEFSR